MTTASSKLGPISYRQGLLILGLCLGAVLLFLFHNSFRSDQALFSNDGPLAGQKAAPFAMPGALFGIWNNLYWLGSEAGSFTPNITGLILVLLGPYGYTNFHAVFSLSVVAFSSWFFFRQLRFSSVTCVLAALAAALNMNFVSNVGWGLSSRALSLAMAFLALAAIESSFGRRPMIKTILAGLAIGMSVSEGGDNGAIFAVFLAAFAFVRALAEPGPTPVRIGKGFARVALMAGCAVVIAAQILNAFVDTAVKGIVGMEQKERTKEQQWDWATQWSLPKAESLRVIIPGLYGYRMDPPDGRQYWGSVGRFPWWTPEYGANGARSSGAGEYAGVLVVLLAVYGLAQSLRRSNSPFSEVERKLIWFWSIAALLALLFSWGRHAPFYRIVYALPYFSTIRNPMKFMHACHLALMILCAYGVTALSRRYLETVITQAGSVGSQIRSWWAKASVFEKRWTIGMFSALALSVIIFLIYSTAHGPLMRHLRLVGFDETQAQAIAACSSREVGLFVLVFGLCASALLLIQSGFLSGQRAKWAGILLGLILVVDLVRADAPWIQYYNYKERYTSNPVIDILKDKPYEHRVTVFPLFQGAPRELQILDNVYRAEWLQHQFMFYDIQALDVPQEPRMAADKAAFMNTVGRDYYRNWQLTNTRYILGLAGGFVDALNQQLAPQEKPFVQRLAFEFFRNENGFIGVRTNQTGPFALIELTSALPRASLYSQWQVITNDDAALATLVNRAFNPAQTVIVDDNVAAPTPGPTNANPGSVAITSYSPRTITLTAQASQPSVLLLRERYNPTWKVRVDTEVKDLLRCNYIMRGVLLPAGNHTVTFSYQPRITTFYITLGSVIVGLLLCGFLAVTRRKDTAPTADVSPQPEPKPQSPTKAVSPKKKS